MNLFLNWLFSKQRNLVLFFFVVWLPIVIAAFPGIANYDLANQLQEFLGNRSVFDIYPIAHDLSNQSMSSISGQNNPVLTVAWGNVYQFSYFLTHQIWPATFILTSFQYVVTVFAIGQLYFLFAKKVSSDWIKFSVILITTFLWFIPIGALSLNKNSLFAAGILLLIGSVYKIIEGNASYIVYFQQVMASIFIVVSVKFGWYFLLPIGIVLLFNKKIIASVLLFVLSIGFSFFMNTLIKDGTVVSGDPVESRNIQMVQIAFLLNVEKNPLNQEQTEELSKIFDLNGMKKSFNATSSDLIKSSGAYGINTPKDSYLWGTMSESDWKQFDKVYIQLAKEYPVVFLQGFYVFKYMYFAPFNSVPMYGDDMPIFAKLDPKLANFHGLDFNSGNNYLRKMINFLHNNYTSFLQFFNSVPVYLISSIMMMIRFLSKRKDSFALIVLGILAFQLLVMLISPLNGSNRYALGVMYFLPALILLVNADSNSYKNIKASSKMERDIL